MRSPWLYPLLQTRREGPHDAGAGGPERAIAQLADRDHGLRVSEPNPSRHARPPGARSEVETRHVGLRVLLREEVNDPHVVGLGHRALDTDRERHRVAVLDQRRYLEL